MNFRHISRATELYGRPWVEREYILVLDAYLRSDGERQKAAAAVPELAELMGRTAASVYMRMENFASIDPRQVLRRRGLAHIAPLCHSVFRDWSSKPDHLHSCADAFRREVEAAHSGQMQLFAESESVAVPRAFGKYDLLDPIGQGGFGRVYSCVHADTNRIGAIKILDVNRINDPESLARFVREIRALQSMDHPLIIRLHEDNLEQERHFPAFVMDLAETSLTEHLGSRWAESLPVLDGEEAAEIFRSILKATDALHRHKHRIIHRDLNPNNILRLENGAWVLADFGLAKFLDTSPVTTAFKTRTQQAGVGTPFYTAPEQYRNFRNTDERTDVYALGVLLWELFNAAGPPMERQNAGLPMPLLAPFLKATDRDPKERFASVAEFAAVINKAFEELGIESSGVGDE